MRPVTSVDRITRTTTRPCEFRVHPSRGCPEHHRKPVQREVRTQMASMAAQQLGPMLTASEVAELLHLHVNTVKRLGDRGELPFYRVCKRGDRRFRLDDVLTFLAVNR